MFCAAACDKKYQKFLQKNAIPANLIAAAILELKAARLLISLYKGDNIGPF